MIDRGEGYEKMLRANTGRGCDETSKAYGVESECD